MRREHRDIPAKRASEKNKSQRVFGHPGRTNRELKVLFTKEL